MFENKKEHLWHMDFDDVNLELIISKKLQVFNPILTVSTVQKLREYFRKSLVIELYWENKIDYKIIEKNKKLKFVRIPKFEEVPYPVIMEPNLVIEYYSR